MEHIYPWEAQQLIDTGGAETPEIDILPDSYYIRILHPHGQRTERKHNPAAALDSARLTKGTRIGAA